MQSGIPPVPPPRVPPRTSGGVPPTPPQTQVPPPATPLNRTGIDNTQPGASPKPAAKLDLREDLTSIPQPPQTQSSRPEMPASVVAKPNPASSNRPAPQQPAIHRPPLVVSRGAGQPSLEQLVKDAFEQGCSDLHLGVGEQVRFRSRGLIVIQEQYPRTDAETFESWMAEVLTPEQIHEFREELEYDGATQYDFARCRINIFDSLRGPAMVMRIIPLKILTLEQLNLPEVFRELCYTHKGLILVTGPTGSGKSTTMAAMVDFINAEMAKNIISIEDPVEFVHPSKKCIVKQREVGIHTHKFDNALKASLREDPDIILIGEMRDRETVNTALKAGQTGHLVFGTLHTNSAVKTIDRILNLYDPDQQGPMRIQIAETLVAVIAQSLVRTTDAKRAAVHEIMINTEAIKDYIRRGEVEELEQIIPKCTFDGMCSMNQSLYRLYEDGRITEETAIENSPKPNEMAQMLRGRI
ncbi:MAG: type IV pilus twitching motility protein PilT [Pseudanabaenaceae cyanobacterium bins.68]|nr:type IV pilus twitching motility protein PilT [Pseudanabaenaceae cyanobacterium bins.68]